MLLSRLRQSRFKFHAFSNEFKRFYNQNPVPIVADRQISSRTLVPILNNPKFIVQDSQLEFFRKVRFYASRFKASKKKETRDEDRPRMNEEITAPTIRLVTDEDHFVISRYEAMSRARSLDLDLVEVDRNAEPPVCKIFDYNKFKYLQQTKEKERAKSKTEIKKGPPKEVRFAGKIKQNDLKIKADIVKRLMEKGHRVKCTATDPTEDVDLKTLLSRFSALIKDDAILESTPKYEKKQAFIVVKHIKFGPSKKSGKMDFQQTGSEFSNNQPLEDTDETIEVGLGSEEVDYGENSGDDVQTNKPEWAVSNGFDDIHPIFDTSNEHGQSKSSKHEQPAVATGPLPYSVDRNSRRADQPGPTNTASSLSFGLPKPAMENRYARDPRSANPQRLPTDMNGRGARNTMNSVPQMPNQGNMSPQVRPKRQAQVPAYEVQRQDPARSSNPNSPANSYGIFSAPQVNTTPEGQNAPAAINRYKRSGPSDSASCPRPPGPSPSKGSPAADSRTNRGLGADNPGQGKWGIFSSDNSSVIPNKNEKQAEVQR